MFVISQSLKEFRIMISCVSASVAKSREKWNFPSKPRFFPSHNERGDLGPSVQCVLTFRRSPSSHVVTTPNPSLPILTLGITQSCVSHEDLTDRPSCGSQAPEHHALRVLGRRGPKPRTIQSLWIYWKPSTASK